MSNLHTTFETYLKKENLRYTQQKKDIVQAILDQKDHFEIDAFISSEFNKGTQLSRATVYRTVKQLLDANLIQKINIGDGKICYEHNPKLEHHDHIICNGCGRIYEMKNITIQTEIEKECQHLDFTPEYRSFHIYGKCNNCNTTKTDEKN